MICALLALCDGIPPVDSPNKGQVMLSFDDYFIVSLHKLLNSWIAGGLRCHDAHVTCIIDRVTLLQNTH